MKIAHTEMGGFKEILERRDVELVQALRKRDGIAIEKSADQMDEIQYASERELAMRNVDRESNLLRQVKAALRRSHDGSRRPLIGPSRRERNLPAKVSTMRRERAKS
jgi:DnaK suppressor protein